MGVEAMVEKLGHKATAEAFVKAREYFEANKDNEPEDERPKPMTATEWREVLEDEFDEGEEEEHFLEEEEEEVVDEEESGVGSDADGEHVAKKAKTGAN